MSNRCIRNFRPFWVWLLLLASCEDPANKAVPGLIDVNPLVFRHSEVVKSKMLYQRVRQDVSFTNELLSGGTPTTENITYKIIRPKNYQGGIRIDENTGVLTFRDTPETVTIQATNLKGSVATYTFTIVDGDVLTFEHPEVVKSKMLYQAQRKPIRYENRLFFNGEAVRKNIIYSIVPPYNGSIRIDEKTGVLTFQDTPETVTIQAANTQGSLATYTFTVADHFSARLDHSSAVIGSEIYVIGGNDGARNLNDVWKSKDGGITWTEVRPTGSRFSARRNHKLMVSGRDLYVISGDDPGLADEILYDVWKSPDGGQTWSRITGMHRKFREGRGISSGREFALVNGHGIYVIGGVNRIGDALNDVWKSTDGGTGWGEIRNGAGPKFSPRHDHTVRAVGRNIYVYGGVPSDSFIRLNDVWRSKDGGQTWQDVSATADKRFFGFSNARYHYYSSVMLGSNIYIIGGNQGRGKGISNAVFQSTDGGDTWAEVTASGPKFSRRSNLSALVVGSEIYVIGGNTDRGISNDVWKSKDGGVTWVNVHAAP